MKYEISIKKFNELTNEELYEVLRLRQEVFVLEQTCLYPDLDNCDQVSYHVMAREICEDSSAGKIAGYLRVLPPGQVFDTIAIGRVLVEENERKKGIARQMVSETLSFITDVLGEKHIKLSAQQYLTAFYESLGFRTISEGYLEDGIPHIDMELDLRGRE